MLSSAPNSALSTADWQRRAAAHRTRAERHTLPARKRKDSAVPHPVEDFLFEYYPYPFALLEKWHPGIGLALEWESPALPAPFSERCYSVANGTLFADPALLPDKERERLQWIRSLLMATRDRAPNFACHGLHEWAMVYGGKEVRHSKTTPLRLPQAQIDELVESRPICCSHHDAFRFFAGESRSMNRLQPTLDTRIDLEQPGCVHANMDLYKWAAKAMPWVGTEVLLDCFELAIELRDLDMRASPYDLKEWDRTPIPIETAEGRKIYENEQKRLASKSIPLRERLISKLGTL
ncbi:MAG: 3-methyladenine DNA glycosylase [Luteolibacter sp.]